MKSVLSVKLVMNRERSSQYNHLTKVNQELDICQEGGAQKCYLPQTVLKSTLSPSHIIPRATHTPKLCFQICLSQNSIDLNHEFANGLAGGVHPSRELSISFHFGAEARVSLPVH